MECCIFNIRKTWHQFSHKNYGIFYFIYESDFHTWGMKVPIFHPSLSIFTPFAWCFPNMKYGILYNSYLQPGDRFISYKIWNLKYLHMNICIRFSHIKYRIFHDSEFKIWGKQSNTLSTIFLVWNFGHRFPCLRFSWFHLWKSG